MTDIHLRRRARPPLAGGAGLVAGVIATALFAGCAAGGRSAPGGPVLPGGPMARAVQAPPAPPDTLAGAYAIYRGDGRPARPEELAAAMGGVDVVFLGELHDDAIGHALQLWLLESASSAGRPVALGLEMFERDVQFVLDEYLAGVIRERDFLAAARPWSDYERFYRPLVEHARQHRHHVLATNAPGRYVSLVARRGPRALGLVPRARGFLPAQPVPPASPALAAKFEAMMAGMPAHGAGPEAPSPENLLAAQNLRDASMADAVANWLAANTGGLVVHVNGSFHSEGRLGIPEHLARYRPSARPLVVTFRRVEDPSMPPQAAEGDDWIVVTRSVAGD